MGINKVNYGNTTLIDISSDTVTADKLANGYTAHDNSGAQITGTMSAGVKVDTASHNGSEGSGQTILFTDLKGEPTSFSIWCAASFTRSTSSTDRYVMDIQYDGTHTRGHHYYRRDGSITYDSNHYSFTYSSSYQGSTNVLKVTSSSTSNYGKFYTGSGSNKLVYTYE